MTNRKDDHVKEAAANYGEIKSSDFDHVRFVHQSIGQLAEEDIDLSSHWLGQDFPLPFYINAMTGGSTWTKEINGRLAHLARALKVPMASGSLSAALKDPKQEDSFRIIREIYPDGFVLANVGADRDGQDAKRAVEILQADALQVHLNLPQEIVMPEGDRDFRKIKDHLLDIQAQVDVPIVIKEVGFGMSRESMEELAQLGFLTLDISGRGGTNFAQIENQRRADQDFAELFDWGQTTVVSLLEASQLREDLTILASGGIRQPLDLVKALSLGAQAVGMSGYFLQLVLNHDLETSVQKVQNFIEKTKLIYLLLNCRSSQELKHLDLILSDGPWHWAQLRGIDAQALAQRSQSKSQD